MADPYFLDRPPPAGYNQTRSLPISNNNYNYNLENIAAAAGNNHGGLLRTPPRFFSAPSIIHGHQFHPFIQLQPPPLLPPPILRPHRSLPSQPARSHSLNPKKSKSAKRSEKSFSPAVVDRRAASRTSSTAAAAKRVVKVEELDLSGCLFALSPPPSSLPLPKFCLRPAKLNCNVEAAGVDDGATTADDLRRLLRLR
ncbi:uncharacterized protein LOC111010153 [Momordica charantia]|uniref:Uncharacterized protein LOC111010153 n=1 Tax=Momordica charantia TaxID=3673 RepID=A0A6J1CF43_MOMCH|nr:uncharacterized protein LOC111010153 [Momordica charantia]